jgi:hypothetical protein
MKTVGITNIKRSWSRILLFNLMVIIVCSCEKEPDTIVEEANLSFKKNLSAGPFEFTGTVYDIASTPDGSILVGLNYEDSKSIEVIKNGEVKTMTNVDATSEIHGIEAIGAGNAFVTTAGTDLAVEGALYKVSYGGARMVADLAAYERDFDPDAFAGTQWKNQLCEAIDGFSAGPQNNPYKLAATSGNSVLVADAAGNTLLSATTTGNIDWKAIFTPPVDENGDYIVRWYAEDETGEMIPCYVQPVPTSVAIGPDGYIYVGELTGAMADADGLPIGISRVWKIPADANNVVCTGESGDCQVIIDGLTSVIDLAIGPDGLLYVVEFDENSWIASFVPGLAAGGTISSYDLEGNLVNVVASNLSFPSAITFDKKGNLWLLENNNIALPDKNPTVRVLNY